MIADNDKKNAVQYLSQNLDLELLKDQINEMSIVAWDHRMERSHLNRWLNNFDGSVIGDANVEKIVALWLLNNYTFYTEREVRELCKCIYADYIHCKLVDYEQTGFMLANTLPEQAQHIIENTIFMPLGNPSESGTSILYFFRQENKLSKQAFEFKSDKEYENVAYIDDVSITGTQAAMYLDEKSINAKNRFILTFIASDEAHAFLKKEHPDIRLINAITLDDRSRCFSDNSFFFSGAAGPHLKLLAQEICNEYGARIFSSDPLGYGNGQQLFGFYYNTPDNTLPIIWSNRKNWIAAFSRYEKKYHEERIALNEAKYF